MKVTVIIPYKVDRGWLDEAIASVPSNVQLLVSQGDGNWPSNFNKVLSQAKGDFIKYLHEDDKLTPNCIEDSIAAIITQGVDFIHGNAIEFDNHGWHLNWRPIKKFPTINDMFAKNYIHSVTLMYKREVFEKIGSFSESQELWSMEEYEFNLRCLLNGFKIGYCDSFLGYYRRHPSQIIRTVRLSERSKNRHILIKKYYNAVQKGQPSIHNGY